MSIMRMRRRFAVHLRYILYGIIGVFVLTLPAIFGTGGGGLRGREEQEPAVLKEPIAEVDGVAVTRGEFERAFRPAAQEMAAMARLAGYGIGVERLSRLRLEAFDRAVLDYLVSREAKKQGISVTKRQISKRAAEAAKQQVNQLKLQLQGQALEAQLAQMATSQDHRPRKRMSERSFVRWMTKLLLETRADDLRQQLVSEGLQKRVTGSVTATEQELLASYEEVTLRELLISFRPSGKPERTPEQAGKRAEELLARLRKGADFEELARTESDDDEAKYTGGLRPATSLVHLSPEYQQAVAGLKTGDLVPTPITTGRGYVIVKVEKREQRLPDSYQKNKQQHLKDFIEQKRLQAWNTYTTELRAKAQVRVVDPEILAYQEIQKGYRDKALPLLEKAAPAADQLGGMAAASTYYELAISYSVKNEWQKAADAYMAASDALGGENGLPEGRAQALLGLGRCYENLGDRAKAAEWYEAAGDATQVPSMHEQLLQIYQHLGNAELVKREQQWLEDYRRAEAERERALQEQQRKMEEEAAKKRPRPAPTRKP